MGRTAWASVAVAWALIIGVCAGERACGGSSGAKPSRDWPLIRAWTGTEIPAGAQWDLPTWSPDGKKIAFPRKEDGENLIWVADAERGLDGSEQNLGRLPKDKSGLNHAALLWPPGGQMLCVVSDRAIYRLANGQLKQIARFPPGRSPLEPGPALSPDGRRIAVVLDGLYEKTGRETDLWSHLYVVDAATGKMKLVKRFLMSSGGGVAWSPDGKRMALATNVLKGSKSDLAALWKTGGRTVISIISSDGKDLKTFSPSKNPSVWGWSRDGRWILFTENYGDKINQCWVVRPDGSGAHRLLEGEGDAQQWQPRWSPRGDRVLVRYAPAGSDWFAAVWRVAATGPEAPSHGAEEQPRSDEGDDWAPVVSSP